MSKRQFQTAAQHRLFFDRKVLRYGYSATVSMGKIIPKEWTYVRVSKIEETPKTIVVRIERLRGKKDDTPNTKNNKTNRPDA